VQVDLSQHASSSRAESLIRVHEFVLVATKVTVWVLTFFDCSQLVRNNQVWLHRQAFRLADYFLSTSSSSRLSSAWLLGLRAWTVSRRRQSIR